MPYTLEACRLSEMTDRVEIRAYENGVASTHLQHFFAPNCP